MLPAVDPNSGLLPPAPEPYRATLEDVRQRFVVEAPFSDERAFVFEALVIYSRLIWKIAPTARLRIDGGFITHKTWAAPQDADIAVVFGSGTSDAQVNEAAAAPLFSLLDVRGMLAQQQIGLGKAHVMGGLVDAFPAFDDAPASLALWHDIWSKVTDAQKNEVVGLRKGYVEVVNPDAVGG